MLSYLFVRMIMNFFVFVSNSSPPPIIKDVWAGCGGLEYGLSVAPLQIASRNFLVRVSSHQIGHSHS